MMKMLILLLFFNLINGFHHSSLSYKKSLFFCKNAKNNDNIVPDTVDLNELEFATSRITTSTIKNDNDNNISQLIETATSAEQALSILQSLHNNKRYYKFRLSNNNKNNIVFSLAKWCSSGSSGSGDGGSGGGNSIDNDEYNNTYST